MTARPPAPGGAGDRPLRGPHVIWICILAALTVLLLALTTGAASPGSADPLRTIALLFGRAPGNESDDLARTILWSIRLPRVAVAALCGGALAAAGVLSQGLFRNALASPSLLGTESGGSLAAATLVLLGGALLPPALVPAGAFAGALAATVLIRALGWRAFGGDGRSGAGVEGLVLAGLACNALFAAGTSLLISLALEDHAKAGALVHWLLGGFGGAGWPEAVMVALPATVGLAIAWRAAPRLDVLALGEDTAASLAVDPRRLARLVITGLALLVAGAIAVAGALPFVGLIVPHLTRRLAGPGHRRLLALSVVNGVTLVVAADTVARTIRAPMEIEVGVLTSLAGAPLFLWLMFRRPGPGGGA